MNSETTPKMTAKMNPEVDPRVAAFERQVSKMRDQIGPLKIVVGSLLAANPKDDRQYWLREQLDSLDEASIKVLKAIEELRGVRSMDLGTARESIRNARKGTWDVWQSWLEINEWLTDLLVDAALEETGESEPSWSSRWPADAARARELALLDESIETELDRKVLRLRYDKALAQRALADIMDTTQSNVAKTLAKVEAQITQKIADEKLRGAVNAEVAGVLRAQQVRVSRGREVRVADYELTDAVGSVLIELQTGSDVTVPLFRLDRPGIIAVYLAEEGVLGYYPEERLKDLSQRRGVDRIAVQSLRSFIEPCWSLTDAISESREGGTV